jgi:cell division protein FtsZ
MNEMFPPDAQESSAPMKPMLIKVIGIGDAGANAVAQMLRAGFSGIQFCVVNTDAQSLQASPVAQKLILGKKVTRGMGAGGDPEVGRVATVDEESNIKELCVGADMVFLLAGLGGGTGTGAAPVVARLAREAGALVLCVVTLPFEFEGGRRQRQALLGLQQLRAAADGVICIPNQKAFKLVDERTGLVETFQVMNNLLAEGVRGIWQLLAKPGLIKLDMADLRAATQDKHAESALAMVEASGENRAREIWDKLSQHVLLDGGRALAEADAVLISFMGGLDMTAGEISRIMEQINRHAENARVTMGAAVDEAYAGRLGVTVIASRFGHVATETLVQPAPVPVVATAKQPTPAAAEAADLGTELVTEQSLETSSRMGQNSSPMVPDQLLRRMTGRGGRRKKNNTMQGQLPLDVVSKGRFEKSEPTIIQGEDLDVPTYIRRGLVLN